MHSLMQPIGLPINSPQSKQVFVGAIAAIGRYFPMLLSAQRQFDSNEALEESCW